MGAPLPKGLIAEWDRYLEEEADAEQGRICNGIFRSPILFPLQRKLELDRMLALVEAIEAKNIMEIGADKGGTFFHLARVPSVRMAIALELRGVPYIEAMQSYFADRWICGIHDSSASEAAITEARRLLKMEPLDVLFLDGETGRIARDFEAWAPLVRPGGLVFIHDIVDDIPPRRFWWSLRTRFAIGCIIDCRHTDQSAINAEIERAPEYGRWLNEWKDSSCGMGVVHV